MERTIRSLAELEEEARAFLARLTPRREGATLVTLAGELGAGKTAFVKEVARAFGVEEIVASPTFVLEKIYALPENHGYRKSIFKRLVHIDAYRLESGAELAPLGFDELMQNTSNLILFEWPEHAADALPEPAHRISLAVQNDGSRAITYG